MTLKSSGPLSLSEINTEFGNGTNLNSYRGRTWYKPSLSGTPASSGTFSSGALAVSTFYRTRSFGTDIVVTSPQANRWAWGYNGYPWGKFGGNQTVRGAAYVSRQIYGATTLLDKYGNPYAGNGLYYPNNTVNDSYDTISYANPANYSVDVEVRIYVGRATDDYTRNIVYRGGSIANISTHSGGTAIIDTGWTTGGYFTVIESVPAKTTYTWYNYSGVMNGSSVDGCTSWLEYKVLCRTGERASSPQVDRWAWGYSGYPYSPWYGGNQTARGVLYVSRQLYGATTIANNYGQPVAGNGMYYPGNAVGNSYDVVSYANSNSFPIDVELEVLVGRATDDYTRNVVYRGGSIANISTHSGGTVVLDTGSTTATRFTFIDTVPANTTYSWYNYAGVASGSGADGCTSWIKVRVV